VTSRFEAGEGDIFLDDLNCVGNESKLLDCPRPLLGDHNCNHGEDAGVSCSVPPPGVCACVCVCACPFYLPVTIQNMQHKDIATSH